MARVVGRLATLLERYDEAEQHFETALASNEQHGFHAWTAWTRLNYGDMLLRRNRPGDRDARRRAAAAGARLREGVRHGQGRARQRAAAGGNLVSVTSPPRFAMVLSARRRGVGAPRPRGLLRHETQQPTKTKVTPHSSEIDPPSPYTSPSADPNNHHHPTKPLRSLRLCGEKKAETMPRGGNAPAQAHRRATSTACAPATTLRAWPWSTTCCTVHPDRKALAHELYHAGFFPAPHYGSMATFAASPTTSTAAGSKASEAPRKLQSIAIKHTAVPLPYGLPRPDSNQPGNTENDG